MKLKYQGKVNAQGDLKIYQRARLYEELVAFADKEVVITIAKKVKPRTDRQNRYYHGIVVPIIWEGLMDAGHRISREQTHQFLRENFARQPLVDKQTGEVLLSPAGEPLFTTKSTAQMTRLEFGSYMDTLIAWAEEYLGVEVPPPNTQAELKYQYD